MWMSVRDTVPVLLYLIVQAAPSGGKERAGSRDAGWYSHHIPKQRDPGGYVPDEQRLLDHIMRGYERSVRPVRNASSPVVIQMGLTLTQILDMDEKNQVLITNVWLDHVQRAGHVCSMQLFLRQSFTLEVKRNQIINQEWMDEFLIWDPQSFNNITKLRIPCHKIWLPDMVLYNNAAEYTDGLMPANAMVEPNGNIFWPVPTKLQSSCKVDVTYFPFDSQVCSLKFGSWTYDGFQVDITNRTSEVDLSNYIVNGEWQLLYVKCVRNVVRYACCDEPFPDVTFYVKIRRRTLYYMYNVVFPCVMMSALTLLVFCLPPDSGEKIALGITVLLAFSVFMLAVAENLPETSEFVPLISIYLTIVMSLTSVSVIMTVFVLNLHHRGPHKYPVPPWLKKLFLGSTESARRRSCFHTGDHHNHLHYSGPHGMDTHCMVRSMSLKLTLENLAHELRDEMQLDNGTNEPDSLPGGPVSATPPSTLTETVVESSSSSTSSHLPRNTKTANTSDVPNVNTARGNNVNNRPFARSQGAESSSRSAAQSARKPPRTKAPYEDALLSLTKLLDRHESEEKEYDDIQDWRKLAQMMDRFLFTFFMIATVSSTLAVLVIVPSTQDL